MKFLTEKVVIQRTKDGKAFVVTHMKLRTEDVANATLKIGNTTVTFYRRWVKIGASKTFKVWSLVQNYLENTIYKDEVYVKNETDMHVDFSTIQSSFHRRTGR